MRRGLAIAAFFAICAAVPGQAVFGADSEGEGDADDYVTFTKDHPLAEPQPDRALL